MSNRLGSGNGNPHRSSQVKEELLHQLIPWLSHWEQRNWDKALLLQPHVRAGNGLLSPHSMANCPHHWGAMSSRHISHRSHAVSSGLAGGCLLVGAAAHPPAAPQLLWTGKPSQWHTEWGTRCRDLQHASGEPGPCPGISRRQRAGGIWGSLAPHQPPCCLLAALES